MNDLFPWIQPQDEPNCVTNNPTKHTYDLIKIDQPEGEELPSGNNNWVDQPNDDTDLLQALRNGLRWSALIHETFLQR